MTRDKAALDELIAQFWLDAALDLVPIGDEDPHPGALHDSGHIEHGNQIVFDAVNTLGHYYGHHVEYGTVHMQAQPFIRPSWLLARKYANGLTLQRIQVIF